MKRMAVVVSVFLIVASAALCLASAASIGSASGLTVERGGSVPCGNITCHSGKTCCFDCSGNPFCVKPGKECPICPTAAVR